MTETVLITGAGPIGQLLPVISPGYGFAAINNLA